MKTLLLTCLIVAKLHGAALNYTSKQRSTDTIRHQNSKHKRHNFIKPHVTYTRESVKGYKPIFDSCVYTNQFTIAQRLKKYPFNIASKILAISYYGGPEKNEEIKIDSLGHTTVIRDPDTISGIIIKKQKLRYDNVKQSKTLTPQQVQKLTDIIFNYGYYGMKNYLITGMPNCFHPRNSIVFLDKNNNVIDHIDICFQCYRTESASGKINIGIQCAQKYQMLQDFFISIGVPYGTITTTDTEQEN